MHLILTAADAAAVPASSASATVPASDVLVSLLLCGLVGLMGQGIRAIVGLKNQNFLSAVPGQQSIFNASYLWFSLMIGFIAGVVAGLVTGLSKFQNFDLNDTKMLLAIALSGYAGADFIENSLSLVIPNAAPSQLKSTTSDASITIVQPPTGRVAPAPAPPAVDAHIPSDGTAALEAALKIAAPKVRTDVWVEPLQAAFKKYDVSSDRRIAASIGQFLVEAGSALQATVENTNYTSAERLLEIFPHAFASLEDARPYVGHPQAIANRVYAKRLGNGDEASGDGYRFRGRGLIQLTGRDEYSAFGKTLEKSAEDVSAYLETPEGAAMSACWYLSTRKCLQYADTWQISKMTFCVNGKAMLGNSQRIAYANAMLKALGTSEAAVA